MKFDSRDTRNPEFEAKGLETVRRDQCALTQKILRNSLIMLFRHGTAAVKDYLFRQWSLIMAGRLPMSDFILTGRVRSRYRNGSIGPVQAALFRRLAESDPGLVMKNKERISYVIVATPGASYKLRDCVLTPIELLSQWDAYTIHSSYYIEKHVNAALQRCFSLAPHGIDINEWFKSCPKPRRRIHFWPVTRTGSSTMISTYFGSDMCSLCGSKCQAQGRARAVVCATCRVDDVKVALAATRKFQQVQEKAKNAAKVCSDCNFCFEDSSTFAALRNDNNNICSRSSSSAMNGARREGVAVPIAACTSIDCPNLFLRHRLREEGLEAEEICRSLEMMLP
jgi:DNA polymerase zeta